MANPAGFRLREESFRKLVVNFKQRGAQLPRPAKAWSELVEADDSRRGMVWDDSDPDSVSPHTLPHICRNAPLTDCPMCAVMLPLIHCPIYAVFRTVPHI